MKHSDDSDLDSIDNPSDAAISEDVFLLWMDSLFAYETAAVDFDCRKRSLECSEQTSTTWQNQARLKLSTGAVMIVLDSYDHKFKYKNY